MTSEVTLRHILNTYVTIIDSPFKVELSDGTHVPIECMGQRYDADTSFVSLRPVVPLVKASSNLKELTNKDIIRIAKETRTAEPGNEGYILPISFAREIEKFLKNG